MNEFPGLLAEFYMIQGLQPPSYQDVQYLMYKFDIDHDGQISYHEFQMMLKQSGGHKQYTTSHIQTSKGKNKGGKGGKKEKKKKGGFKMKGKDVFGIVKKFF